MLSITLTDHVFVLTGAGVSAESGIPTFRGVNGLWRNYRIEEVASPHAWARDPRLVWEFYSMRRRVAAAAKPNPAHFALAKLEESLGDRLFLCTQNVDNLHESGLGLTTSFTCMASCSKADVIHAPDRRLKTRIPTSRQPNCHDADAAVESAPHICWFGETPFELDSIFRALDECTVFMGTGTSGVVEPAASFVAHVRGRARTI